MIHECIANFGPAPREFSLWDRWTYLRLPKPPWLYVQPNDKLKAVFQHAPSVWAEGTVVWGHIVQANQLMFRPGPDNCPGEVVYSLDESRSASPKYLGSLADELYDLKGAYVDDPGLAKIANHLANEQTRVFGLPVPPAISPVVRCRISTTIFFRKHLPGRRLCSPLLPLVVNPQPPYIALPLPERYWPTELIDMWIE